jgi:SAM-dependent methyltransferase
VLETVRALVEEGRHGEATQTLLESLGELSASRVSSQEKLNHLLFTSRTIQAGGAGKHGYQKLLRKVNKLKRDLAFIPDLPVSGMLDLGCGTHDPLGLATYFYLNGYGPAYCCDLSAPRNAYYSALSMYEIMANIRAFPERYRFREATVDAILERWRHFDVEQFELGRLTSGVSAKQPAFSYHIGDVCDLAMAPDTLGLVVSFAVLEHVQDIDAVLAWLHARTRPGGVHYHFIDMADHRSYEVASKTHPLAFLTERDAPPGMNRLRASEHLAAFERAGFQVLKANRKKAPLDEGFVSRLLPPWRDMSEEDLTTLKLTVVLRKP